MRQIIRLSAVLSTCSVLLGCANAQINHNAVNVSAHVSSVYTDEALTNLSRFIDDRYAIPSQIDLTGGTVQSTDTIQPSVTVPFTAQIANTATGVAASALTLSHGSTIAGSGATLGGSNAQQLNYNFNPLVDANTLRNLQGLYRFVIYGDSLRDPSNYRSPRVYFNNKFYADPYQLQRPHCVLCSKGDGALEEKPRVYINPDLHGGWLHWSVADGSLDRPFPPGEQIIDIGHYGNHELFMSQTDYERGYLSKFVFFIMPNQQLAESFGVKVEGPQTPANPPINDRTNPDKKKQGGRGTIERPNFQMIVPFSVPTVPQTGGRTTTPAVPPGIQF